MCDGGVGGGSVDHVAKGEGSRLWNVHVDGMDGGGTTINTAPGSILASGIICHCLGLSLGSSPIGLSPRFVSLYPVPIKPSLASFVGMLRKVRVPSFYPFYHPALRNQTRGYDKGEKAPRRHVGLRCSGGNPHARTGPAKASGACGFALLGGNPPARTGPARQGRRSILWLLRRAGRVGLRCLEATHMRTLDLQGRAMVENTTITKPGRKGDIEVAVEPETPDLEGEVKSTVLDGSTIPTALKRAICLEGSVTEDVTPTRALSRLLRKSPTGEVIGASRGVRMAKSEML
nr:hypothetical protein Iba_chr05aCG9650 [Ipomoea batatas]